MILDIEQAFKDYLFCALWSSVDFDNEDTPLDEDYSIDDIDAETEKQLKEEFEDLCEYASSLIEQLPSWYDSGQLGHDFWLTRNGHGVGFWDRGLGKLGEELTEASKTYGSLDLYVSDGKIYS